MRRLRYPTDLDDEEWERIQGLIPPAKRGGRPRSHDMREIVNAICYLLRTRCPWRLLPHDLPPWPIVYHYFQRWQGSDTWSRLEALLPRKMRPGTGRGRPRAPVAAAGVPVGEAEGA
jgi:transposase